MKIYHSTDLICDDASHDDFIAAFAEAVSSQSDRPFLLVRSDDARMLVATKGGDVLIAFARDSRHVGVSYGSTYVKEPVVFRGLISCLLYTSPSPRDQRGSRMPSSA